MVSKVRVAPPNSHSRCAYAQDGTTSLLLATINNQEAAAEALIAPTASAGALDVQVRREGEFRAEGECE